MLIMSRNSLGLILAAVLAWSLGAQAAAAAEPAPAAFAACQACHSTDPARRTFGPSLAGVAGRKAGSLPGYAYSEALKGSGLTWDQASLDRWLAGPARLVPGAKMPFGGIADPARRAEVVRYLMTLR